jgi:MFS family permease
VSDSTIRIAPGVATQSGIRDVLRYRDFRLFWFAAIVSNSASWMQTVAVAAHLWNLTQSATWLGASGFAMMIPATVLTPYAGVLADRLPRRLILGVTQSLQMVFAFVFFAVYKADLLTPWRVLGLLFCTGIISGIQMAAWQSFVPTLVPREHLVTAVRLNSVQFQASRAIGPMVGALALALFGIGAAFLANAVTFIPVVLAVLIARPLQTILPRAQTKVFEAMAEGFRYTWARASMRRVVIAAFLLSAFGQSLIQLTAAMATQMYGRGSDDNAGLVAAFGLGSVVSGLTMVFLGEQISRSATLRAGLTAYVCGVALLPLTSDFRIGLLGLFVCGLAHIPVATTFNTFMQSSVPDQYRGRVVACYLTGVMLGMPIGSFALGRLGDVIGMRETIAFDAVAMAMFASVLILVYSGMRFIDHDLIEADTDVSFAPA